MPYDDLVEKHARRVGVDPAWMKRIMQVESGGQAGQRTGSYKGLFQLSDKEFQRGGGTGNIYDPEQNTMAAANKLAREKLQFKEKYGREPTLTDIYMVHQQGNAGYDQHMSNPDKPAWQNMLATGEGKAKGERWAKAAIWGNLSAKDKAKFGSVENVTSGDFIDTWSNKIEGTVTGREWAAHRKAAAKSEPGELSARSPASEELQKKPSEDEIPQFQPPNVVHPDVGSPDISMGRPVVAPILSKAGRVPM